MNEHSETQREVFDDLLQRFIGPMDITPLAGAELYGKWINRFDTAATRTAAIEVFVEALSARLKAWVKEQAAEAAQWVSVSERLPQAGAFVLVAEKGDPDSIEIGRQHGGEWADSEGCRMHPTHWRPLPALPMEVLK